MAAGAGERTWPAALIAIVATTTGTIRTFRLQMGHEPLETHDRGVSSLIASISHYSRAIFARSDVICRPRTGELEVLDAGGPRTGG